MTTVPISGRVLSWAREEDCLTKSDLAQKVEVSVESITSWEAGKTRPTRGQFTKLVKALRRPSAVFFLPEPPVSAGMPTELRSAPALDGHQLGPDEARQIRRARRLQQIMSWLLRDEEQEPVTLAQHSIDEANPVAVARTERSASGISVRDQTAWCSLSEAFRAWRDWLEIRGVLVMQLSMKKNNIRGFGVWDDYAPLVAVNTAYHQTARIFTLFHEVGHLLTRTDSACQSFIRPNRRDPASERWCERFAASFLLPAEDLKGIAAIYDISIESPTVNPNQARLIANKFSVSTRAAAIRLLDLSLGKPGLYEEVVRQFSSRDWRDSSGGGGGGQPASEKRIGELGKRLPSTLLLAEAQGRLTTRDLADYLQLKTGQLDDLRVLLEEGHSTLVSFTNSSHRNTIRAECTSESNMSQQTRTSYV